MVPRVKRPPVSTVLCASAGALFVLIVWLRPGEPLLYGADGACYARVSAELAARRLLDWAWITLGGAEFHEHPPLLFWIEALAFRAFGVTPGSAVFVARLFATLTGTFVFATAWRLMGARAAGMALLSLLVLPGFLYEAQNPMLELPLMAWLACGTLGVALMGERPKAGAVLFAVGFALAFWTKGPPALALLPLALLWAYRKRTTWRGAGIAVAGAVALTALSMAGFEWLRALRAEPSFFGAYFSAQVVESAVRGRHSPDPSPLYFFPIVVRWYLPALLAVPLAAWAWRRSPEARPAIELGVVLALIVLAGFSIPVQKHSWYIHPMASGAALFMGAAVASLMPVRFERALGVAVAAVAVLAAVLFVSTPSTFAHRAPEVAAIQRITPAFAHGETRLVAHCGRLGAWVAEHLFAFFWDARKVACDAPEATWRFDGEALRRNDPPASAR